MPQPIEQYIGHLVLIGIGFLLLQIIAQGVAYYFKKKVNSKNNNPNSKVLDTKLDMICKKLDVVSEVLKENNRILTNLRIEIAEKK